MFAIKLQEKNSNFLNKFPRQIDFSKRSIKLILQNSNFRFPNLSDYC